MSHRKTSVEIKEELLTAVQQALSTSTIKDTIEEAFREILRARLGAKRSRRCRP